MDQERFLEAYHEIVSKERERNKIGTLGEKTIHAVLKYYYEPDRKKQEVKIGNYVADIFTGTEIMEIQTKQFNKLRKKLVVFLKEYPVTIVHPISQKKWIYWIDSDTGEVSKGRVSPRHGCVYDAFYELYKIKPFLIQPGLTIRIPALIVKEYKYLNGWSKDKKRGASRIDQIPIRLEEETILKQAEDYAALIPKELPDHFTCKEFAQYTKIRTETAQIVIHIFCFVGVLQKSGQKGHAFLYKRSFNFLKP